MPDQIGGPAKKIFLAVAAGAALAVLIFGGLVGYYYWHIKSGRGAEMAERIEALGDSFSRATRLPQPAGVGETSGAAELVPPDAPFLGNAQAPLVIVEFLDFKCPFCAAAHPILRRLVAQSGDRVKLVARHFPSEYLHPGAENLALGSECARLQNKFWPWHDWMFSRQTLLPEEITARFLSDTAGVLGLNRTEFERCLNSYAARAVVNRDLLDALDAGVAGTPTFFVNGQKVEGVVPFEVWEKVVENFK